MYRSLFSRDVFAELDRLQQNVQQAFEVSPTIRGMGRGGFPALNVGGTPQTIEIYAFAPGIDPQTLDAQLERGLLTISGERPAKVSESTAGDATTLHINERFHGAFRRVITLPDDADPDAVSAHYQNGVVHITIQRRSSAQPRRITIH